MLSNEVAVVIFEGDFRLGRLVEGMTTEPYSSALRRHLQQTWNIEQFHQTNIERDTEKYV